MIARVLPAPHVAVHAGGNEALRQRRTEQKMIDAEPGVAAPGISKEVPKGIDGLARMQFAYRHSVT